MTFRKLAQKQINKWKEGNVHASLYFENNRTPIYIDKFIPR